MPSAAGLVYIVKLVAFVTFAYYLSIGRSPSMRGVATFVMLMIGALGMYEGFSLAVREESRLRYGHVVSGAVVDMYESDGSGRTYASNGRQGPHAGTSGYLMYEAGWKPGEDCVAVFRPEAQDLATLQAAKELRTKN